MKMKVMRIQIISIFFGFFSFSAFADARFSLGKTVAKTADSMPDSELEKTCSLGRGSLRQSDFLVLSNFQKYQNLCASKQVPIKSPVLEASKPSPVFESPSSATPPKRETIFSQPTSNPALNPIKASSTSSHERFVPTHSNSIPQLPLERGAPTSKGAPQVKFPIATKPGRPTPASTGGFVIKKTPHSISEEFQQGSSMKNIFQERTERIKARKSISREEMKIKHVKTNNSATITTPRVSNIPNESVKNETVANPSPHNASVPIVNTGAVVNASGAAKINQTLEFFGDNCKEKFSSATTNLDNDDKNFMGQDCCQVMYTEIETEFYNKVIEAAAPGTKKLIDDQGLKSALMAAKMMSESDANNLLSRVGGTFKDVTGPMTKNFSNTSIPTSPIVSDPTQVVQAAQTTKPKITPTNELSVNMMKQNIKKLASAIKVIDTFFDDKSTMIDALMRDVNMKDWAAANSKLSLIKTAAKNNYTEAKRITIASRAARAELESTTDPAKQSTGRGLKELFDIKLNKLVSLCPNYNFSIRYVGIMPTRNVAQKLTPYLKPDTAQNSNVALPQVESTPAAFKGKHRNK